MTTTDSGELGRGDDPADDAAALLELSALSARRLRILRALASAARHAEDEPAAWRAAAELLARPPADLAFAALYAVEPEGRGAHRIGDPAPGRAPDAIDPARLGDPAGAGAAPAEPAGDALVLPIARPGARPGARPWGALLAGPAPGRALDEPGRDFLALAADQVAAVVAAGRAREDEAELRRAMTLREAFLSAASHELRTPMMTLELEIEGLVRALEHAAPEPAAARYLRRAEKVRAQATRLEQLIDGLFDAIHLDREHVRDAREEVDLAEIAHAAVAGLRGTLRPAPAIELAADPTPGSWNRAALERVAGALLSNALKFGAGKLIEVVVQPVGPAARLVVRDRGVGIDPADHERIFQRFERAVSGSHYSGLGLGLWLVRELVEAMDGTIRVVSRRGQGAAFIVELPRER